MTLRGRHWVILWLGAFLATTGAINLRQPRALATAARVRSLRDERASLEARRADLERRIRLATGRSVLKERAELQLGLHQPRDTEVVVFRLRKGHPPVAR